MTNTKEKEVLKSFHIHLLNIILLVTFSYTLFKAIASIYGVFPLIEYYRNTLFLYSFLNLFSYLLLRHNENNFVLATNIATLSSIVNFSVMAYSSTYDEFRLVWFFFSSVAAFMFLGKKYGVFITTLIILSISFLHFSFGIGYSTHAVVTFITSMIIFDIFLFSFLTKIENDEETLQERIRKEIFKQQKQEKMLLRQQRMANMGEMIDAIAHQWRQPLNQANMIVMTVEDMIMEKVYSEEDILKELNLLTNVTAHMSQTINDFRNLLSGSQKVVFFNLNETIEKFLELMRNNIQNIDFNYSIDKPNKKILGYKNELIQVLIILFSNAIEALIQSSIKNKQLSLKVSSTEKELKIVLQDNAGGMKEETLNKVFDPYFTTKKQQGGTGLGLYIAKIIIEQNMNGKIIVRNGKTGAIFTIILKEER